MNNSGQFIEQTVTLSDRARLVMTGVSDVESFSDTSVIAVTSLGHVSIDGEELKIESFSTSDGKLVINGKFDGFCYFGRENRKRRLFGAAKESER